jgi:hypothetical protein
MILSELNRRERRRIAWWRDLHSKNSEADREQ